MLTLSSHWHSGPNRHVFGGSPSGPQVNKSRSHGFGRHIDKRNDVADGLR
jgi:hypothetical protein